MITVDVKLFDIPNGISTITWPLKDIEYAEQLVNQVLDSKNVGPAFRTIFGLRVSNLPQWLESKANLEEFFKNSSINPKLTNSINDNLRALIQGSPIWLAPNANLRKLIGNSTVKLELEIRMRFRPSSLARISNLDSIAFDMIFSQIRHDFIHTKFNEEKKDFVLANQSVMSLVITDLVRHALEHDIDTKQVFKKVKLDEFIPHKASKVQRFLISRYPVNLQKYIQIVHEKYKHDVIKAKSSFIETFFNEVSTDYGTEVYYPALNVCANSPKLPIEIRIRYSKADSNCYIEFRQVFFNTPKNNNHTSEWTRICDIYSVGHGSIRENTATMNHSGTPHTISFLSSWHAESFMSLLDGYYRSMRLCYFHLCRDITSPSLDHLKKIRSHGPTGWEFSESKLSHNRRVGSFLVRCCLENRNRFLIDVSLDSGIVSTLDIDWNPIENSYKLIDYTTDSHQDVTIKTDGEWYPNLNSLIADVHIKINDGKKRQPQQLKYWLQPSEYEVCPPLLFSLSEEKLDELENNIDSEQKSCLSELPRFIPPDLLHLEEALISTSSNRMAINLGTFVDGRKVVIKSLANADQPLNETESLVFHSCQKTHKDHRVLESFKPAQARIADWIFIKYRAFAESIGIYIANGALIQEYFSLGPLDKFLARNIKITSFSKLSISYQIADALLYLQEKRIIHGKLRCHNIFIHKLYPIEVKITDPLGTFNAAEDQAFIPPEYLGMCLKPCINDYESGIDVWAFGTTLWQVYSCGRRPPPKSFANTFGQPRNCPNEVWNIIESCWIAEPCCRASPQSLHRDLYDLYIWEKEAHNYYKIPEDDGPDYQPSTTYYHSNSHIPSASQSTTAPTTPISSSDTQSDSMIQLLQRPNNLPTNGNGQTNDRNTIFDITRKSWKDVLSLARVQDKSIYRYGFGRLDGDSDSSTRTCSTPTGSDTTKMTILHDLESLSDAIDESIWHVDSKQLKLGIELGRGSSGHVIKGVLSREEDLGDQIVAVKCIDQDTIHDRSKIEDLRREFDILKNLNHDNIVRILGFVDEASMMLVMEYMPLGSLQSYLKNSRENLHSLPLKKYALDIANGMNYLECMKIVHRDLALRNILVETQDQVKICDFGLAQFLGSKNHYTLKTDRALPLKWYAPEVLDNWTFTHKTDVWSYGVVLWEIYSGGSSPQYSGTYNTLSETLKHERLIMPKDCPPDIYDLMLKCWANDPEDRYSFRQISENLIKLSSIRRQDH